MDIVRFLVSSSFFFLEHRGLREDDDLFLEGVLRIGQIRVNF